MTVEPTLSVATGRPLADRTTLRVGGPAEALVEVDSVGCLTRALDWARERALPIRILGGGSNLVVDDDGVDAVVLHMAIGGVRITTDGVDALVEAGAGEDWCGLVDRTTAENLAGFECLAGIPGTVGATPIQNVGAYGREVSELIEWVECVARDDGRLMRLRPSECGFGYRTSRFKARPGRWIVTRVCYRLARGAPPVIRYPELARAVAEEVGGRPSLEDVRRSVVRLRASKGMVLEALRDQDLGSVGSFFVNPVLDEAGFGRLCGRVVEAKLATVAEEVPRFATDAGIKVPAAWLIERSGFARGWRSGRVGLSPMHALALVTYPGARAEEVHAVAARIQTTVREQFGVDLEPEPVFWGRSRGDVS